MMGRTILKGGKVIDPRNHISKGMEIAIEEEQIVSVAEKIEADKGDKLIQCEGMEIWPGLIDMHLHVSDLFEIHTNTAYGAVENGVTTALTPGAGNTFMAPALLGAEMDRGLSINVGTYIGAANVLGTMLNVEELIQLFSGRLDDGIKKQKLSKNAIVNRTAQYVIGIKEHMGHYLLPDEKIEMLFEITSKANLMFMSHTQDIEHTNRLVSLAKGRNLHLGHANAVGCGTHGEAVSAMKQVVELCGKEHITAEFVTTMLRAHRGCREGLCMEKKAQEIAFQALADEKVNILVSDGQNQSVMKGFGDTRDNIPCILELTENGILNRKKAVALMTANPCELLYRRTGNLEWKNKYGHLGKGAYANVIIVDPKMKYAPYVFTNGKLTAFEQRFLRSAGKAGNWVSKFGTKTNMEIGEIAI